MSQITFKARYQEMPVEVVAGWDNPMREFFLTVFSRQAGEKDVVWSSIDHPSDQDERGITHFQSRLASMKITEPKGFWEKVKLREGNVYFPFPEEPPAEEVEP